MNREKMLTKEQEQILFDLERTKIQPLEAIEELGPQFCNDLEILKSLMINAIKLKDDNSVTLALELYWLNNNRQELEYEFNEILKLPNHNRHQRMLKFLQDELKYPSSVDSIRFLLNSDFKDYFLKTGSDDIVVVQWLSHALVGIGTEDAMNTIVEYSNSNNQEIAKGMKYRLKRIEERRMYKEEKLSENSSRKKSWLQRLFKGNSM